MTEDLQKQYDRELKLLTENLDTIMSELQLINEHLARMELLKELQKEGQPKHD
ncbi:hypothetical protein ES705_38711 [subsurface metagenome]